MRVERGEVVGPFLEILSYVIKGALEHRDSSGGSGVIRPNELQRMSAGTGISHSESNPSATEPTHFLQIWILPERNGLRPEYEQREFPASERRGRLRLIGSRDGSDGSVTIHQNVSVYDALLEPGDQVSYRLAGGRHAWVQVIQGKQIPSCIGVLLIGSKWHWSSRSDHDPEPL